MNSLKKFYTELAEPLNDFKQSMFVRVVHLFDKQNPRGGATVAYRPLICDSTGFPQGKFAEVSVAWCSKVDTYDRKLGELIALAKLSRGECVSLPLYVGGRPVCKIKQMFEEFVQ